MTLSRFAIVMTLFAILLPLLVVASSEDEKLISMETKMYETLKSKDLKAFGAMLTDDAVSVDPMKVCWTKAEIMDYLTSLTLTEYNMKDSKVVWLNKDTGAVIYTFSGTAKMGDQAMPPGNILVTTIWVKTGNQWLAKFHQETPLMPPTQ